MPSIERGARPRVIADPVAATAKVSGVTGARDVAVGLRLWP